MVQPDMCCDRDAELTKYLNISVVYTHGVLFLAPIMCSSQAGGSSAHQSHRGTQADGAATISDAASCLPRESM